MNKNRFLKLGLFMTVLSVLAACNREAQPSVSAVGSWQGTLTTMTGGSGTQSFTAEITEIEDENADYAGVFTVGDEVYNVIGRYNGYYQGEIFVFQAPLSEVQPALSPVTPLGFNWSGVMTKNTYQGGWYIFKDIEARDPSQAGEFSLERLP
jgi:hypothetical protein